ncbi:unnamed protein product [Diamesa hyperborea]
MVQLLGMDFSDADYVRSTLRALSAFTGLYILLYRVVRAILKERNAEYCCRILTFIHGIIASSFCLYFVVLPTLGLYKVVEIPLGWIICHSFGYFVFDMAWMIVHGEHPIMKFHHVVTVSGLFYYSFKIKQQYVILYAIGLTEITNPFLQVRWFLKFHNRREGIFFKITEAMLIILFFTIRVVVLSIYGYQAFTNKSLGFEIDDKIFITLGLITGYALSIQMINYIIYQLKKSNKESTKDIKEQ